MCRRRQTARERTQASRELQMREAAWAEEQARLERQPSLSRRAEWERLQAAEYAGDGAAAASQMLSNAAAVAGQYGGVALRQIRAEIETLKDVSQQIREEVQADLVGAKEMLPRVDLQQLGYVSGMMVSCLWCKPSASGGRAWGLTVTG